MTSTTIYTPQKPHPYVYICTHLETGEFYIGYRSANKEPAEIDFPKYRTSSKVVNPRFEKFDWQIIAEFFDSESAYKFEQQLIYENFNNPLIMNKCCHFGKQSFRCTGHSESTKKKMSDAHKGKHHSLKTRKRLSDILSGLPKSTEHCKKISDTRKSSELCREASINNLPKDCSGTNNGMHGKNHTKESRAKMSKTHSQRSKEDNLKLYSRKKTTEEIDKMKLAFKSRHIIYVSRLFDRRVMDLGNFSKWNNMF